MGWIDVLEKHEERLHEQPPEGYSNVDQIAEKMGWTRVTASRKMRKLFLDGKVKRVLVRGAQGSPIPYYED